MVCVSDKLFFFSHDSHSKQVKVVLIFDNLINVYPRDEYIHDGLTGEEQQSEGG